MLARLCSQEGLTDGKTSRVRSAKESNWLCDNSKRKAYMTCSAEQLQAEPKGSLQVQIAVVHSMGHRYSMRASVTPGTEQAVKS